MPYPNFGGADLPANKATLAEVIEDTGVRTISYLYDFGDGWENKLRIGKITEAKSCASWFISLFGVFPVPLG